MPELPSTTYLDSARTEGELKTSFYGPIINVIEDLLGGEAESELTISSGAVTPDRASHQIDTESDASSDDLTNIATDNMPDGRFLLIRCVDAARAVVVKHAAGGSGQIHCLGNNDKTLSDPEQRLMLQRVGSDWYQILPITGVSVGDVPNYETDGSGNPIIKFPSPNIQAAITTASTPVHYERDVRWRVKNNSTSAGRITLVSPNYVTENIDRDGYVLESSIQLDLSDASSWDDTSTTDWTQASNRAGKDFYVYACEPSSGYTPDFICSPNSTTPDSMPSGATPTSENTRKTVGFHCLCADVGTNVANPADNPPLNELDKAFVSHDITGNTHWMTGFVAGDILPFSVWDLIHRPADWAPEGMYFDALSKKWLFIYLASWDGQQMVSAFGATIADGDSSPAFHWYNFDELLPGLPFQGTFSKASRGSPQAVNINGGSDPGTTGGHSATDGNRIISLCGGEDMTGVLWQWGAEGGATNDVGSNWSAADTNGTAGTYDDDHNIDRGEHYEAPNRPLFGGGWSNGSKYGSRGSYWPYSPVSLNSFCGARGVAEPKK